MMEIEIRQEEPADYIEVEDLVKQSFSEEENSDHTEHFLVRRLRNSPAFNPALSLVAVTEKKVVGYILFTEIKIGETTGLALAPIAVLPEYQNQKIGGRLIKEGHRLASRLSYPISVVLGHAEYYPRFGYIPAHEFDIQAPFDVLPENFLAVELLPDQIKNISGLVQYTREFFDSPSPTSVDGATKLIS